MAHRTRKLSSNTLLATLLLVGNLCVQLAHADYETGKLLLFSTGQAPGTLYPSPFAACYGSMPGETYELQTRLFVSSGSTSYCGGASVGTCRAKVKDDDRYGTYTGVNFDYECGAGSPGGGSSCENATCVRPDGAYDPYTTLGEPKLACGNPVNVATGNKYQLEVDLAPNRLGQLRIERSYNSFADPNVSGPNEIMPYDEGKMLPEIWTFYYTQRLQVSEGTGRDTVFAVRPDGGVVYYNREGDEWEGEDGNIVTLTEDKDAQGVRSGWHLTLEDHTIENYDRDGRLVSIYDRNDNYQSLTYDHSRLHRVTTNHGDYLEFEIDDKLRIVGITDNASPAKSWTYVYDSRDNLIRSEHPDGTFREYHYDRTEPSLNHALTRITDEKGVDFAKWNYNYTRQAISSEHATGGIDKFQFVYDNVNNTTIVTNPLNKDTVYQYDVIHGVPRVVQIDGQPSAYCPFSTKNNTYDSKGFMTSRTDWEGNKTTYTPDPGGRNLEASRTEGLDALGNPIVGVTRTVTTTWHPVFRLPEVVTVKDHSGTPSLETTYTYDANGNLDLVTRKDLTVIPNVVRVTDYDYELSTGRLTSVNGPRPAAGSDDDITSYTYYTCTDGQGKCGQIQTITNALQQVTEITQYDDAGNPTHVTDPNGVETVLGYDSRQRLISIQEAGAFSTIVAYEPTGKIDRITLPSGNYLDYDYDDAQRLDTITDALGNRIELILDNAGNIEQIDTTDGVEILKTQSFAYDELSRARSLSGGSGQTLINTHDLNGNIDTSQNGARPAVDPDFDALDRMYELVQPDGGKTTIAYDEHSRIKSVTHKKLPQDLVTTYQYNAFGDLLELDSPDTGITTFEYDEAGNVIKHTDARGKVVDYTYDYLNRQESASSPDDYSLDVIYTYDDATSGRNGVGRLTSVSDKSGTTDFFYNSRGMVELIKRTIGANVYYVRYGYDEAGNLASITYPSGRFVRYLRDVADRITQVTSEINGVETTLASNITYYPFGPMKDYTLGNLILRAATHDQSYRIDSLSHGSIFDRGYTPDVYDNFTVIDDRTIEDKDQSLTYDDLDRLETATGVNTYGSIDFGEYDPVGNRKKVNLNSGQDDVYGYSATSNRLDAITGLNPQSFSYDAAGNMVTRGNYTHTYNAMNRMETSTPGGGVATTYIHNAFGERVQKVETAKTTHYIYHGPQLLFEYDGTQSKEYVYLNDQPLAVWHGSSFATTDTVSYKPNSGSQDGEEKLSNGNVNRTEDTLDMAQEDSNLMLVAIRYKDVAIPPAATILGANIQFKADGNNSGSVALDIHAEDIGSAPSIEETNANLSSRTKTQANVSWSPNPWTDGDRGPDQLTPELKSIVQEVVDRPDWISGNHLMVLISGSGKRKAKSYNASADKSPKLTIEYLLPGSQPEEVFYFHNDHLGTPQAMTDAGGSIVWQADYKPFGEANVHTETIVNNLRLPGQYFDAESGLHYNYFRDYDPGTGRYIQSDPIGLRGGINTYAYVGGNPMRFSDPLGLAKVCKRPLSFMGELQSSGSSGTNLGIYHQQLFYEDGTGDNIGFTTTGLFDDRKNTNSYQCDSYSLDDDTIRQAEENIRQQEQWNVDNYNVITNNCQDYIDVLLWEYIRLNSPNPEISGPR